MKKVVIIIIVVVSVLFLAGIAGGVYFVLNYPKLEKIELDQEKIELKKGEDYIVKVKLSPKNAKNINIVTENSNKKVVKVEKRKITALTTGESEVCYMQKNNKKVKDCIKVTVATAKSKAIERANNLCTKKGEGIYDCGAGSTLNLNDYTYKLVSNKDGANLEYTYHFTLDYIDGFSQVGDYNVKYNFNTKTRSLGCVGNVPAFHNIVCNTSNQQTTINLFDTMIYAVDTLLGDISIEDLKAGN